ncbi:nucleolar pre-ribosomal-associated protein 1 [Biomphalaria glabrata]|uniref:Uncharacterized protein LOC106079403 isoform X2 n=1 Tax=Biomphalaria glabrata TaxID=6526 RepID=A0A9U8EP30_BIOGL|nr:uncharacterized protein LOC106079403 isoform X2 [Biomphalaria glabrata]KAI8751999.1 hypothetical protein BgiMline_014717 [Biomphalaria glabrata]
MQSWVVILIIAGITLTSAAEDLTFYENVLFLDDNITLAVNPPYIINGLASNVDVRCLFKRDQVPAMSTVLSLVIAYSNATDQPVYSFVASVNVFEGHAHNISHDVEVISGSIDNRGESSLHIRFKYPDSKLTGVYVCEVQGFDRIGRPITKYTKLQMLSKDAQEIFNQIDVLLSTVNALQMCRDGHLTLFDKLLHKSSHTIEYNFTNSALFQGHRYLLADMIPLFDYNVDQTVCNSIEGYLIELDTPDEMAFFERFLAQTNATYVWTGAKKNQHGVWYNEHNSSVRPLFTWLQGQPLNDELHGCQCAGRKNPWKLLSCQCSAFRSLSDTGYICEVPEPNCYPNIN